MRHLVYVHGATRHPEGYSLPWYAALQPHLQDPDFILVHEVNYSDIMTPFVPEWFIRWWDDWRRRVMGWGPWVKPWSPGILDDLVKWPGIRNEVIDRVMETLGQPLLRGADVTVVCHSFGTIVMPEVLWSIENDPDFSSVKNLIMWGGSPGLAPVVNVWTSGKPEGWAVHRPMKAERIFNLGCSGDFAAGPLPQELWRTLGVDMDKQGLPLVGPRDIPAAHADGFNPANTVCQKLMADAIELG